MTARTAAPASLAVFAADAAGGVEFSVAGRADIVVAVVALVAVKASLTRLDGPLADIAVRDVGKRTVFAGGSEV